MDRSAPSRLPLLDGLRGLAALAVMLFHEAGLHGSRGFLSHSYMAVDFFMLLSGFVLARSFEPKMAAGLGTRRFMVLRLKRLYPLMALGTLIGAAHLAFTGGEGPLLLLLALGLAFVPRLAGPAEIFPLNGPQWSLLFELAANLLHVVVLRRLPRLAVLAIGGLCLFGVLRAALHYGTLDLGWQENGFWVGLVRTGSAYCLGVVMARTLSPREAHGELAWLVPMALLPALLCGPMLLPGELRLYACWAVMAAGFPLLMLLALRTGTPARFAPLLDWLGRLSFPLYAVHVPLLTLAALLGRLHPAFATTARLGGVGMVLGAAALLAETRFGGRAKPRPALSPALT